MKFIFYHMKRQTIVTFVTVTKPPIIKISLNQAVSLQRSCAILANIQSDVKRLV